MAPARNDEVLEYLPEPKTSYDINIPYKKISEEEKQIIAGRTEFPDYLPVWDKGLWFEDFPTFDFHDPALRADKSKPHLFTSGVAAKAVTPKMGTILTGVRLETLSTQAKDELALLISERKFVVFREQGDFLHSGPQFQKDFMSHFGKLSRQPVSGAVKGHPEFHVIHRDGNEDEVAQFFKQKMTATLWHHDVSYERQPPGYVMLGILACPDVGGDTVVADMAEAYKRLSPTFQSMLEQLSARHTSAKMIAHTKAMKGTVRAAPISSTHPIVRIHPVTGEKALFYNAEFPEEVLGLKDQEAECIMKFVMDFVRMGGTDGCSADSAFHSFGVCNHFR